MSSLESLPQVATFVVPVPRTSAVAEIWAEFAGACGVSENEVERILKRGIQNFLIQEATISFLDGKDEILFYVRLDMDWKKHTAAVECAQNISLLPSEPFTLQLHDGFKELFTFIHAVKKREGARVVELTIRYRDEIYADPDRYKRAQEFLGTRQAAPRKLAPGRVQPDLAFRFAALPETTITITENWT